MSRLFSSSYGSHTSSSGKPRLRNGHDIEIKDKDILIVEDIIDTGLTLAFIIKYLQSFHPKSIKACTFIDKYERREVNINIDFKCHVAENGFSLAMAWILQRTIEHYLIFII